MTKPHIRSSIPTRLIAAAAAALLVVASLAATPFAYAAVPRARGTAAIRQAAEKVKRMTGASSDRVSQCSSGGSGVTCQVHWGYNGYGCRAKLLARPANGAVKVRRASPIRCNNYH